MKANKNVIRYGDEGMALVAKFSGPASEWEPRRTNSWLPILKIILLGCTLALILGTWASHAPIVPANPPGSPHVLKGTLLSVRARDGQGGLPLRSKQPTVYWYRRHLRSRASAGRRKVRRTRAEIDQERRELLEKTQREIDAIVAEFHAKLPRDQAKATGSVYARDSSRFQNSIADQVRTLFEAAHQLGIFIPRELVFFDMAVRGWKDRRPGLTALRQAIKQKQFEAFLVFTTSRLFRRTYKALQFVEEELVERGIRGVFVKSHLDTADGDNWRTTFQLFAAMDEAMVRMYAEHVRAAHEGLFLRGMVFGSLPLGYTGEVVPGEFTKRKRPRRKIIVDSETAPWIEQIFRWFVEDRLTLDEIARRLNNDPNAPAPNKSLTGWWTHALVRQHLMQKAYRGYWAYGATQTKWSSDKDYAQRVPREKPLKSGEFEERRIVADELWYAAQKRPAENCTRSGRKPKDGERHRQPNSIAVIRVIARRSKSRPKSSSSSFAANGPRWRQT